MRRIMICAAIIALCALLIPAAFGEAGVLMVAGTGVVELQADTASIRLGVREVSPDIVTAQAEAGARLEGIVARLIELGVRPSDVRTSDISLYPNYDYNDANSPIVGYTAENTVTVITHDIDRVGALIDAAFEAGANTFYDIAFSAASAETEYEQALALAVESASKKAQVLASAAGMKVGQILSIVESESGYAENGAKFSRASADEAVAATPVYASPLQVSATVTMQFSLETVE